MYMCFVCVRCSVTMVPKVITEECMELVLDAWGPMPLSVPSLFQTAHVEEHSSLYTDIDCVYVVICCLFCVIEPLCMAV